MDNLDELKEELKVAKEELTKLKRHFSRLEELYGDNEDLIIQIEKRLYELQEATPKSKLRKLEDENNSLKDQIAEFQAKEKEFAREVKKAHKDADFDATEDFLNI